MEALVKQLVEANIAHQAWYRELLGVLTDGHAMSKSIHIIITN